MNDERPNPDALLAEAEKSEARQQRGRLKVFFGMSAGVGKTYAMLEEARKRAAEGVDVVVGYAEPHIRPDTEAVLLALDLLPYRLVEYRNTVLKEFDLDAALARRPAICCVDELAHTNAPGLRHPKRWQDIGELLDAGINVYTTLNVQHLESVNDLVERITGVQIRETLPDAVFDAADEVELVDIAPVELLERFREGRIYKPEQAERASRHFFTKGNLIALRELALRKTAERVDAQMLQHRREERIGRIIPASEKVLVCVGPSPFSARLIRSARRLAASLRVSLVAVAVERPGVTRSSAADQANLNANLQLAEQLGATIVTLSGEDVAAEVLAYANAHNVTKIVVGKSARPRWKDVLFGSVVDDMIRNSGEIDIYVIRGGAESRPALSANDSAAPKHDTAGYINGVAAVAATTAIGWPLYHNFGIENENILMLYLLGVMWVASRRSRAAAILASVLAVAAFDVTFVPPYYTFAVSDRQYVVTFGVMLLTALVISVLTHRVRSQGESARQRERRTAALLGLSRDLARVRNNDEIAAAVARHVTDAIGAKAAILIADPDRRLVRSIAVEIDDKELSVAQWAFDHRQPAGRDTSTLPAASGSYFPMSAARGIVGVLAIHDATSLKRTIEQRHLLEAFADQAAIAIERANLIEEARSAWEHVEAEFLRNTLLSGVSHDLRTPLAGITGAASALAANPAMAIDNRQEMLETLLSEAERMERLINNLLDMTRMEAGGLTLKKEWMPLEEIIGSALRHLESRLHSRSVQTHVPADLPMVHVDGTAIEQVLVNLIDNAIQHAPGTTSLDVTVRKVKAGVSVEVADHGPGIPPGAEKRVFDKFFRASADGATKAGVGLGLAICRGLIEAHGGTISAANRPGGGGAAFTFTLPIEGTPPVVDASA